MSSLYQLSTEYQALLDLGDSPDPEDQRAFLDTLEGLDFEVGLKADSYAAVISQLEGRMTTIKAEIDRLTAFLRAADTSIERMEKALYDAMRAMDKTEIRTDLHTFKIVKNGGKAPLTIREDDVPKEYQRTEVKSVPDKAKIREALEAGKDLPFAELGERGSHLVIK